MLDDGFVLWLWRWVLYGYSAGEGWKAYRKQINNIIIIYYKHSTFFFHFHEFMMSFSWAEHIFPTKLFRSPTRMHFVIPMAWWPPSRESLLPAGTDRFRHSTFTRFLYDTWFIISLSNLSLSVVHLQILYSIMYHMKYSLQTNTARPPCPVWRRPPVVSTYRRRDSRWFPPHSDGLSLACIRTVVWYPTAVVSYKENVIVRTVHTKYEKVKGVV